MGHLKDTACESEPLTLELFLLGWSVWFFLVGGGGGLGRVGMQGDYGITEEANCKHPHSSGSLDREERNLEFVSKGDFF